MLLLKFLESVRQLKTLPEGKVFCFVGNEYPLLFFYHLISFFKKNGLIIESIDCVGTELGSIKAVLATMSFSGEMVYWLENFYLLSVKKQQELCAYMRAYDGPHRVLFFSNDPAAHGSTAGSAKQILLISLPQELVPHEFGLMRFLIHDHVIPAHAGFARRIATHTQKLSLDSVCLFTHYELVVGAKSEDFFTQWVGHIIEPTTSLFLLSQHFFAKKSKSFFQQWAISSDVYMPQFWATFWADQIWRAYILCDLMKQKKYGDAKKAQYKLPFSFINGDWRAYSLVELQNAHHFLATLDFQLKNGFSEIGLEYFYIQFFAHKFR